MNVSSVRRGGRRPVLFAAEIAVFGLIFWADEAGLIPLSKTPFLFVAATASLWLRRETWRKAGFDFRPGWLALLALGVCAGAAFWAFEYFVENPLLHVITGKYPDLSDFRALVGNVALLGILVALNLVLAAIGEELVWRGYALTRVAQVLGEGRLAWAASLLFVNVSFGLAHLYQGESGIVQAAVQGVLLGLLYLATGRNLLAPIAAHFTANNIDFAMIFLGLHPGLGGSAPG